MQLRSSNSPAWGWFLLFNLIAFILLAWLKTTESGRQFDAWVLSLLQSVGNETRPLGPAWLREAGRDLTALGSISVLLISMLAVAGWLLLERMWRGAILLVSIIVGGTALSFGLKMLFSQPRPDLISEPTQVFTSSFPSSHAMASLVTLVALAWVIGRGLRSARQRAYLIGCAVAVSLVSGFSRLYLGVHWPSDVLAGWFAGLAWLCLCALALKSLAPQWLEPQLASPDQRQPE